MYHSLTRKLKKWYYKKRDNEELGVTHYVELRCPNTDKPIATEQTELVHIKRDIEGGTGIWTYRCDKCFELHSWLWGPPAPIHVKVPEEAKECL